MLYLKHFEKDGMLKMVSIPKPIYVRRQSNGMIVTCPWGKGVQGVLSPDGSEIWQLKDREPLSQEYLIVEPVTMAEYDEWEALQNQTLQPDPEDTDPVIPENVEAETVMTRAELTAKVMELDEAMELLLSGVTEDA